MDLDLAWLTVIVHQCCLLLLLLLWLLSSVIRGNHKALRGGVDERVSSMHRYMQVSITCRQQEAGSGQRAAGWGQQLLAAAATSHSLSEANVVCKGSALSFELQMVATVEAAVAVAATVEAVVVVAAIVELVVAVVFLQQR